MARRMNSDLLLLGSIPLETPEEVFRWAAANLGAHLSCIPDGEPGDRSYWITGLAYRVFSSHPDIETILRPDRVSGVENWKPQRGLADQWSFRVKPGVDSLKFGDAGWRLGYARDAISSYFIFKTLRENGVIDSSQRFQICLPTPVSTCAALFRDDREGALKIEAGLEDAMAAEVAKMFEKIPAGDVVIQWDCTSEPHVLGGDGGVASESPRFSGFSLDPDVPRAAGDAIIRLSSKVPSEAMMGFHLCYGSLTEWPMFRPKDLSGAVRCMDTMIEKSARPVDFIHFPILPHAAESYFAPLKELPLDKTRYYLGVIHYMDDLDDYKRRLDFARKYIPEFGVGAPCGYGRLNPQRLPRLLEEHLTALEIASR